ncbi:MAG: fructosamine kinase family protein [Candidatus Sumerlaeaceae bacterium]|nr:fructosamine kinase family protein [Candidatus Sumerlaeaceae bacterium]
MIPGALQQAVTLAVANRLGGTHRIVRIEPCGGGCINRAARLTLDNGLTLFLKWNDCAPPRMFAAEAEGLRLLRKPLVEAGIGLRVPEPWAHSERCDECPAFLLMEDLIAASNGTDTNGAVSEQADHILAQGLAAIHRFTSDQFGLDHDNFIGSTPQVNGRTQSWAEFFLERRLRAMLSLLAKRGALPKRVASLAERSLPNMGRLLESVTALPSLVHGDLWGGNVLKPPSGFPALIDPAVYFGDREVDLAMTELFGGFSRGFRLAYESSFPLSDGYVVRKDIYNLYHILNHALLFGGGYMAQAEAIMSRFA